MLLLSCLPDGNNRAEFGCDGPDRRIRQTAQRRLSETKVGGAVRAIMTRARFLKIAAGIFVAGIAVGALCTAIIAPVGFGKLADRIFGQIEPEFEQRRDNQRRYYESLPPANLTPDQIIARMQEDKGLHDQKLARMVEWYLYARKFEASEDVRRNDHLNPDDLAKQVYDYFMKKLKTQNISIVFYPGILFPSIWPYLINKIR